MADMIEQPEWTPPAMTVSGVYCWDDCARDLALVTPLTLSQAGQVVAAVRDSGLDAEQAFPYLRDVFSGGCDPALQAAGVLGLVRLTRDPKTPVEAGLLLRLTATGQGSRGQLVAYVRDVIERRTTPSDDTSADRLAESIVTSVLHRLGAGYAIASGGPLRGL